MVVVPVVSVVVCGNVDVSRAVVVVSKSIDCTRSDVDTDGGGGCGGGGGM